MSAKNFIQLMQNNLAKAGNGIYQLNIASIGSPGTAALIVELELRESAGGPNVAVGGVPYASDFANGFLPANAFDANLATYWSSNTISAPWNIGYQFATGVTRKIVEYAIYAYSTAGYNPTSFTLFAGEGSVLTHQVDSRSGVVLTPNAWNVFTVQTP